MRIDKSLSALLLAAMLDTALTGCQRQEMPPPKSELGLPLPQGERFGAPFGPPATDKNSPRPSARDAVDPHHPWMRRQGLIET
ncbi:MAG TPA: hypothetical protein VLA64_14475 [Azonexus sp.]|nr:hypothetical protein [Azonexus sp.]